jgi:type IV pilus assembly protein PilA
VFSTSSQRLSRSTQGRLVGISRLLRERSQDDSGFTFAELLVVILIIGILAAIAIPAFAAQKGKSQDAQAKELVRTAETTAESIATDNNGEYAQVSLAELHRYEPTIPVVASTSGAYLSAATPSGKTGYSVTATATDGDEFSITKTANGEVNRTCVSHGSNIACVEGSW